MSHLGKPLEVCRAAAQPVKRSGALLKGTKEVKVCYKELEIVCEYLPALVKTEPKIDTKNLCEFLFSIVDCCLYVCKSFIAYVAYSIYNYTL